VPQAIQVAVDDRHLGSETARHASGARADGARSENDDAAWTYAGRTPEQDTASAGRALEVVGAYLRDEAAGNIAHRRQDGQCSPLVTDSLHRERCTPRLE
jgi:hypothetical protein